MSRDQPQISQSLDCTGVSKYTKLHIFGTKHKANTWSEQLTYSHHCISILSWSPQESMTSHETKKVLAFCLVLYENVTYTYHDNFWWVLRCTRKYFITPSLYICLRIQHPWRVSSLMYLCVLYKSYILHGHRNLVYFHVPFSHPTNVIRKKCICLSIQGLSISFYRP